MECRKLFRQRNTLIAYLSLFLLILPATILQAQTPTNYSGIWKFDLVNSNLGEGAKYWVGDEVIDITQDSASIKIAKTFVKAGSKEVKNSARYTFDGNEITTTEDFGTTKLTAKWSADNKIFIVTTLITTNSGGISKDYLIADTYKLSENGQTLTVESFSKNDATGERTLSLVYKKKINQ